MASAAATGPAAVEGSNGTTCDPNAQPAERCPGLHHPLCPPCGKPKCTCPPPIPFPPPPPPAPGPPSTPTLAELQVVSLSKVLTLTPPFSPVHYLYTAASNDTSLTAAVAVDATLASNTSDRCFFHNVIACPPATPPPCAACHVMRAL